MPSQRPNELPYAVGVLGGMGPRATHHFLGELLTAIEAESSPESDQDYPDVLVSYRCSMPDRTAALTTGAASELAQRLREGVGKLHADGCQIIVVPCMTAHALLDAVREDYPSLLDVPRLTGQNLVGKKVGVLSTRGSRLSGVTEFFGAGEPVITLEEQQEERLMNLIYSGLKAASTSSSRPSDEIVELGKSLQDIGADVVVAGCTELEMALARNGAIPPGYILPLRQTARTIAKTWCAEAGGDDGETR